MRNLVMGCAVAALVALSARSEARPPATYQPKAPLQVLPLHPTEFGVASWYGVESQGETASGELYDMEAMTAAHRTLPLQSTVRVTNLKNLKSVVLRINDRGPNVAGRTLDVSEAAARRLGFIGRGLIPVKITVLRYPRGYVVQPGPFDLMACSGPLK